MDTPLPDLSTASDAELIRLTKAGDDAAYSALFVRHHPVALAVARSVARPEHAEDVAAEAFARVLSLLREGRGPGLAFRPYLLATVRNVNLNVIRSTKRETLVGDHSEIENLDALDDGVDAWLENNAISRAYKRLPRRWQTVLWLTAVEKRSNEEIAQQLGIKPNAVAAVAFRAREGLRESYLADHLQQVADPECQRVVDLLPAYLRGNITARRRRMVEEHVAECVTCAPLVAELQTASQNFAALIAPLVVGPLLAKLVWDIDEVLALPWLGSAAQSSGAVASGGWPLGVKVVAGLAAAAAIGAVVVDTGNLPEDRPGAREQQGTITQLNTAASGDSPASLRSDIPPAPTSAAKAPALNRHVEPGAGHQPTRAAEPDVDTEAPPTPPPVDQPPIAHVPNPRIGSASSFHGLLLNTALLPLDDGHAGTVMEVQANQILLANATNLAGTGWTCLAPSFDWLQGGLWAKTTFVCTWDGTGSGVLRLTYKIFGLQAPLTARLTSTPGGNADLNDDVTQLTMSVF
jgi:RNA polymerase sigma factor (sigma-70 family)